MVCPKLRCRQGLGFLCGLMVGLAHVDSGLAQKKSPASPAHPFKTYVDAERGVSFIYPASWTADARQLIFYGGDPLLLRLGDDNGYDDATAKAGWLFRTGNEEQPTAGGVTFVYAALPEKTAKTCKERVTRWKGGDSESVPDQVAVHGVRFDHIATADAGLGHQWNYDLYATFLAGRCYGFEAGANTIHVDEYRQSALDAASVKAVARIIQTVRFGPQSGARSEF
jgi:hypothetical protein